MRMIAAQPRSLGQLRMESRKKRATAAGWFNCDEVLTIKPDELQTNTGTMGFQQLDRELDHLRLLDLIFEGFVPEHTDACIISRALGYK